MVQLSHSYMTTGKIIALTIRTFVSKMTSLHFNMLSRFVIAFLPWSTHLLIWFYSWANRPGPKVKSHHCSTLTCGSKDSYKDHQDQAPGPSSRGKSRIPNTPRWWLVWWRCSPNPLDSLISQGSAKAFGTSELENSSIASYSPTEFRKNINTTETSGSVGRRDKEHAWLPRSRAPAWQLCLSPGLQSSVTSPAPGSLAILPTRPSSFPF